MERYVAVRFGLGAVDWLKEAVGGFDGDYGRSVLRWAARGLPPDQALKKVAVDAEAGANAGKSRFEE